MSRLKAAAVCMISGLVFTGCNSESSDSNTQEGPTILDTATTIRTNTDAYNSEFSITRMYRAHLSHSESVDNIVLVEIRDTACDCTTVIHDTRPGSEQNDIIDENGELTSSNYYGGDNYNVRALGTLTMRVVDSDGNEVSQSFTTDLLEPDISQGADFVYSERYTGTDKSLGYPGLTNATNIAGTIENNGYVNISFDLNESRAESAYLWFCSNDGTDIDFYGSDLLKASNRLVIDGQTSVNLNWAEVGFSDVSFETYKAAAGAGVQLWVRSKTHTGSSVLSDEEVFTSLTSCVALTNA